ncbi:MAG: hypothetical protein IJ249_05370 [Paludibacteraceae bacterium]|nr:hypothetical protein [Paludibacteraceae bacterium]
MKKLLFFLVAGCALMGCRSDIDLKNIDAKAQVDGGLALPVGSLRATIGDFLGAEQVKEIKVDEYGIFHFVDTIDIPTKDYRKIDVASYIIKDESTLHFSIADKIGTGTIHGDGTTVTNLLFDLELGMKGINEDATEERIDSIWISEADFTSIINVEDFQLDWSEIQGVQLILSDQFRRPEGKTIDIPVSGKGFAQEIPIKVRDFTLCLMKDKTNPSAGTVNKVKFQILFKVRPTNGHEIPVSDDSKFAYNLQVKVINYDAIWGLFEAGNEMRDEQKLNMDSLWEGWKDLKKLKVRFAEPSIEVFVSHKIAAPLRMYIDSLTAVDSLGNTTYALWDGDRQTDFDLRPTLSPYSPDLNDSVTNTRIFNYEPSKGHIDRMFDVRPDYFSYGFHLQLDKNSRSDFPWNQHRITADHKVRGYAVADLPFKFNKGSELEYITTFTDVDLSKITLDSLLASADILDTVNATDLKLIMRFENKIPFNIDARFVFLDKDSINMNMILLQDSTSNHIRIPAPKMTAPQDEKSYGEVLEATDATLIIRIDKSKFDRFAEVKHIRMDAAILDNPQRCIIKDSSSLLVQIGITAQIDAVLDFNKKNK